MSARIVTLDVERIPGRFAADFWDLNAFKNRRISPDEVTDWPRTICLAWRWLGQHKVHFAAEWEADGYDGMLRKAWEVYDRADIVVGHNLVNFDTKHLRTGWRNLGLTPPAPFKQVDTLTQARRVFGDESMQLVALTARLGIATKTDKYDPRVARAACAGDRKAQRKLAAYNKGDIIATEELYLKLLPWMSNHPHRGLYNLDDADCCGRCGKTDTLEKRGYATTQVGKYQQYVCKLDHGGCGAWSRGRKNYAAIGSRPVTA